MCADCGSEACKVVLMERYRPIICDCCGNFIPRLKDAFAMKIGRLIRGYACEECAEFTTPKTGATDV